MTPDVDNVLAVFRRATVEQYRDGHAWYPETHQFARSLSRDVETAAGVIAALSPRIHWDYNMTLAREAFNTGKLTGGGFSANVAKANRILGGEHPTNVLGQGRSKKTLNFYHNIVNPYGNEVTVDTWAFRIATGITTTPTEKDIRILQRKGVYDSFAESYREAAILFNIPAPAMQAITWVVMRGKK